MAANNQSAIWILYDGECPFCSAYVRMTRLQAAAGTVHLIDVRTASPVAEEARSLGFDFDEGMALKIGDRFYHGADAMHRLALLTSRVGLWNRVCRWIFKSNTRTTLLYPALRAGRNLTLKLLGRAQVNPG